MKKLGMAYIPSCDSRENDLDDSEWSDSSWFQVNASDLGMEVCDNLLN
jgi:hypothetical protein